MARRRRVGRESQIADPPGGFLLQEIADVVPGGIHVGVEELLLHAVEEIEVKVICPAARQLLFKYMFQVCPRLHVELGCQEVAVPGIALRRGTVPSQSCGR